MAQKKPSPTFEVLFTGPQLYPERIPLYALAESLRAIQRLAVGEEAVDEDEEEEEPAIGLITVKRGSAVFQCVAKNAPVAIEHLEYAGKLLAHPEIEPDSEFDYVLAPVRRLSAIAQSLGCSILVRRPKRSDGILATIDAESYKKISTSLLLSGETTILGWVERVGGATDMRCALRVPSRHRLLFCDVESQDVSRKLGQHLYEEVAAIGLAHWIHRTWRLFSFKIRDIYQPERGSILAAFDALRNAGGKAWEKIPDPGAYLQEVRT